jgi:hypothetical protein
MELKKKGTLKAVVALSPPHDAFYTILNVLK